jgi:hypothetical protein
MARESGSRSVMPTASAGIGAGGMLGRTRTDDPDRGRATAWPQSHPNHATEA